MTLLSKVINDSIRKYEELGGSRQSLSKALVGAAVFAYTLKLSYPILKRHMGNSVTSSSLLSFDKDNASITSTTKSIPINDKGIYYYDCDENRYNSKTASSIRKRNKKSNIPILENDKSSSSKLSISSGDDNEDYYTHFDDEETMSDIKIDVNDEQINDVNSIQFIETNNSISTTEVAGKTTSTPINLNNNSIKKKKKRSKRSRKLINEDVQSKIAEAERLLASKIQTKLCENIQKQQLGINKKFLLQLKKLLNIMIPRPLCYETTLLCVHTICLISRTFLSIYVASLEGAIVKFIVRKDVKMFALLLLKWFGIAIPATFINSMIRYLENKLALAFRTRLVKHSYRLYFKSQNYYRVSNLDGRIENADHRLTEDISVFSSSIAHLYSHLTKPCFDLMLIGLALMRSSQKMKANLFTAPLIGFVVISATAHILRVVSPKFGQLVSEEANRYGYLRHVHSRIITNAEEIAFYGGHKVELIQLREAYNRLIVQMNTIFTQKLWFIMLEQFFMKYVWSGTGMIMVSLPILASKNETITNNDRIKPQNFSNADSSISERTQYLTTARNLLISAADAIERLMSSYKEIVSLAGYTNRVAGMLNVFEETSRGIYEKPTCFSRSSTEPNKEIGGQDSKKMNGNILNQINNTAGLIEFKNGRPIAKGKIVYSSIKVTQNALNINKKEQEKELLRQKLSIELKSVPVVTPNCEIVVSSLSLRIEPGTHVLITGPNGCGKSSLFRILSGLWPIYGGELHIPKPVEGKPCMFYIPQRPYMSIGSLCDQIIYPDTRDEMLKKNTTENELKNILKKVALEHIAIRDSFDVVRDWKDILSGGEKQRMAIARLFYHKPNYALLDECTSAVSIDVESSIYEMAKEMGITLLTITHRPTLWKFHTHILEFDGLGGWNFRELTTREKMNGSAMNNNQETETRLSE